MRTAEKDQLIRTWALQHAPVQIVWVDALYSAHEPLKRAIIDRIFGGRPWPNAN